MQKICKWGGDYKGKEWFDYVSVKDASWESSATIDEKHCSYTLSYTYNILGSYTNILDDKGDHLYQLSMMQTLTKQGDTNLYLKGMWK